MQARASVQQGVAPLPYAPRAGTKRVHDGDDGGKHLKAGRGEVMCWKCEKPGLSTLRCQVWFRISLNLPILLSGHYSKDCKSKPGKSGGKGSGYGGGACILGRLVVMRCASFVKLCRFR